MKLFSEFSIQFVVQDVFGAADCNSNELPAVDWEWLSAES